MIVSQRRALCSLRHQPSTALQCGGCGDVMIHAMSPRSIDNLIYTMNIDQPYDYDPIPNSSYANNSGFRLLSVFPQRSECDDIQCALKTTMFDNHLVYQVLSYTWGSSALLKKITVDNKPMFIRENLFQFLKVFQASKRCILPLWVDQICINQDDISERNTQVQLMGRIYSCASLVIVWLGKASERRMAAVDAIRTVHEQRKLGLSLSICQRDRQLVEALLNNSYFTRL